MNILKTILALTTLIAACGESGSRSKRSTSTVHSQDGSQVPSDPYINESDAACKSEPTFEPIQARVWLLSAPQYTNSVSGLLGVVTEETDYLPVARSGDFVDSAGGLLSNEHVRRFYENALDYSEQAESFITGNLPCSVNSISENCKKEFIDKVGMLLFRQPVIEEQRDNYLKILLEDYPQPLDGFKVIIATMLQSPYFLYRHEYGVESEGIGESVLITPFEFAANISLMVHEKPLNTADYKKLALHEKDIRSLEQRSKILEEIDQKSTKSLMSERFMYELLQVNHLYNSDLAEEAISDLTVEFNSFVSSLGKEKFQEFFLHPHGEGSSEMRAGILTTKAFLAAHTSGTRASPVKRGYAIRRNLFCQQIPDPPQDVNDTLPSENDSEVQTNRDVYKAHLTNQTCKGCHELMDPIGFTLENFDYKGIFRTHEMKNALISSDGYIVGTRDMDKKYKNPMELSAALGSSKQVESCIVQKQFRYVFGQNEAKGQECQITNLDKAFDGKTHSLENLFQQTFLSRLFIERKK